MFALPPENAPGDHAVLPGWAPGCHRGLDTRGYRGQRRAHRSGGNGNDRIDPQPRLLRDQASRESGNVNYADAFHFKSGRFVFAPVLVAGIIPIHELIGDDKHLHTIWPADMRKLTVYTLALPAAVVVAVLATGRLGPETALADADAASPKEKKVSNLDFWLSRATTAPASRPADESTDAGDNPFSNKNSPIRGDAVPGVIEMSDGRQLPGWLYTTRDKPWVVFDPALDRWRQIPFITVLSITAVVTEEKYELQWRWKGMGQPEKVFTGRKFPYRRFLWEFRLIDGSTVRGAVKGQPVWVRSGGKAAGPMVLHERDKGKIDMKLKDVHYVRKIVVSTKMRDAVLEDRKTTTQKRPAK